MMRRRYSDAAGTDKPARRPARTVPGKPLAVRGHQGHHQQMSSAALDLTGWPAGLPPVTHLDASTLSDTDVDAIVAINEANRLTYEFQGTPSVPRVTRANLEYGWDGEAPLTFVVRAGQDAPPGTDPEKIIALLEIWYSTYDNLGNAYLAVIVHPDWRRRGIGSALLGVGEAWARANGRMTVMSGTREGVEPEERFAEKHGYHGVLREVFRRQVLAEVDREVVARELAAARVAAADYELVRFSDRIPDDLIEAMVEIDAAINDAPRDDSAWEDEVPSVDRMRASEEGQERRGGRKHTVMARRRSDGAPAGQTTVSLHPEAPTYGHQWLTAVVREHRGHRLGMLLKAEMLAWLAEIEPQLETIDTDNAGSNDHMIAINEKLGYRVVGAVMQQQKELAPDVH